MNRRRFLVTSMAGALSAPVRPASAQPPAGGIPRVGVLMFMPMTKLAQDDFRRGLREHGYVDGQNVAIEWRSAEGRIDRAHALADELVRLRVSVIVAEFTPAAQAAKKATGAIPIILASAGDPVATGLVASLARPGGNITGFTNLAAGLSGKRLELLREVIPRLARVGLLILGTDPLDKAFVDETRSAATRGGIPVSVAAVPRPADIDAALAGMAKEPVGAVIVPANLPVPLRQLADLTLRHRLPSISLLNQFAEAGGLMSYGASVSDIRRPCRQLRRQGLERREARRPSGRAADEVRAGDQSQNSEGARSHDPAVAAGAGGSGHRVDQPPLSPTLGPCPVLDPLDPRGRALF
jgi:putative tryptophan/tyrosine transport system substrate-binding protein